MTRSRVILTAAIAVAITVGNLSAAVRAADHGAWVLAGVFGVIGCGSAWRAGQWTAAGVCWRGKW